MGLVCQVTSKLASWTILELSLLSFDHISTTTCCMFHSTKTRLTLKLSLMRKKQKSWQSSKFQMRWSWYLKTKLISALSCFFMIHIHCSAKWFPLFSFNLQLLTFSKLDVVWPVVHKNKIPNVCSDICFAQSKTVPNIKGFLGQVHEHASLWLRWLKVNGMWFV